MPGRANCFLCRIQFVPNNCQTFVVFGLAFASHMELNFVRQFLAQLCGNMSTQGSPFPWPPVKTLAKKNYLLGFKKANSATVDGVSELPTLPGQKKHRKLALV